MANQKIRIKLKAYEHGVIDQSAARIVETAKRTGSRVSAPSRCPRRRRSLPSCVLPTSIRIRASSLRCAPISGLIDILNPTPKTVDALTRWICRRA